MVAALVAGAGVVFDAELDGVIIGQDERARVTGDEDRLERRAVLECRGICIFGFVVVECRVPVGAGVAGLALVVPKPNLAPWGARRAAVAVPVVTRAIGTVVAWAVEVAGAARLGVEAVAVGVMIMTCLIVVGARAVILAVPIVTAVGEAAAAVVEVACIARGRVPSVSRGGRYT